MRMYGEKLGKSKWIYFPSCYGLFLLLLLLQVGGWALGWALGLLLLGALAGRRGLLYS